MQPARSMYGDAAADLIKPLHVHRETEFCPPGWPKAKGKSGGSAPTIRPRQRRTRCIEHAVTHRSDFLKTFRLSAPRVDVLIAGEFAFGATLQNAVPRTRIRNTKSPAG